VDETEFAMVIAAVGGRARLRAARAVLGTVEPFAAPEIEVALRGLVERMGVKPGQIYQPVRVAIAGTTVSPGIFESIALLGQERTLSLIDQALDRAGG
jgi:glutamyl-tRNA synthetase